jgi:hypothetical protein
MRDTYREIHMRVAAATVAFVLAILPAYAVQVRDCDYAADVRSIAEPWEKNTRSFYDGNVRVALLDTGGEPVCCSVHLLVLVPDKNDEMGGRFCRIVGDHDALGFAGIDFARLTTRYDAGRGLLVTFPYQLYVDGLSSKSGVARVRVNVERGTVGVE